MLLPVPPLPVKLMLALPLALPVLLFEKVHVPMSMSIVAVSRASVSTPNWR